MNLVCDWDNLQWVETYSVNLLIAELRLRRCERYNFCVMTYSDDVNLLKTMVQKLGRCTQYRQNDFDNMSSTVRDLIVRTHWLSSSFSMWLTKSLVASPDTQEYEIFSIENIDCILSFLQHPCATVIHTPQLTAPGRIGKHWCQLSVTTVKSLRDEIQLNAVLSSCRQKFQHFLCSVNVNKTSERCFMDEDILRRYSLGADDFFGEKHRELITDFMSINGEQLLDDSRQNFESSNSHRWPSTWDIISTTAPIQINVDHPSLLTVISYCLASKAFFEERMLCLCVGLAVDCMNQLDELSIRRANTLGLSECSSYDSDESMEVEVGFEDASNGLLHNGLLLLSGAKYFMAKAQSIIQCGKCHVEAVHCFAQYGGLSYLVKNALSHNYISTADLLIDDEIIKMVLQFVASCIGVLSDSLRERSIDSVCLWLSHYIVSEEEFFTSFFSRVKRNGLFLSLSTRANIFSIIASELTMLILQKIERRKADCVPSDTCYLFINASMFKASPLILLLESLYSMWQLSTENSLSRVKAQVRAALKQMQIPIASLITIISLSVALNRLKNYSSLSPEETQEYFIAPLEYCDSDESSDELTNNIERKQIFQMASVVAQCVGLILNNVDDKDALDMFDTIIAPSFQLPLLLTVSVKVLGMLADHVLSFCASKGIWSDEYPSGFRSSGLQIDSFLCKVYRLLYGIVLMPQTNQIQATNKDFIFPSFNTVNGTISGSIPESLNAAAQLYRCIVRVYRTGRRHPPKTALECILRSLPSTEETDKAKAIKGFIWKNADYDENLLCQYESNVFAILEDKYCTDLPSDFPMWTLSDEEVQEQAQSTLAETVRKGIVAMLAKAPMPRQAVSDSNSGSDLVEEREQTFQTETALSHKVNALIDSLCFTPNNYDAWFQAGLCMSIKAEIVHDRLPPLRSPHEGCERFTPNFDILLGTARDCSHLPLSELLKAQFNEFSTKYYTRLETLGDDLSFYINHSWANFHTLGESTKSVALKNGRESTIFLNIGTMYDDEKYSEWQKVWGRLFVSALHRMSKRCLHVALALYCRKKSVHSDDEETLHEDIAEALGTAYYNNLMGSVAYGYPTNELTPFEKRFLATRAIVCFQQVIAFGTSRIGSQRWDLHFMIGKVRISNDK